MQYSYDEVQRFALSLPEDQHIRLANSLYKSVDRVEEEESEAEVEAAWDGEIKRRIEEIDSGAVELIPGEKVLEEMIARLSPEARARLKK